MNSAYLRSDFQWFPSRLFILDNQFELISNYWHPGHLRSVFVVSFNNEKKIIIFGVNNYLKYYYNYNSSYFLGLALLDPNNISGYAPPYWGDKLRGTQEWYAYFTPPLPQVLTSNIQFTDVDYDDKKEIAVWTDYGYIFYLNESGIPIYISTRDNAGNRPTYHLFEGIKNDTIIVSQIFEGIQNDTIIVSQKY